MKLSVKLGLVLGLGLMSACATPYGAIYTGINTARAYRAATPNEVITAKNDPEVKGTACAQSVLALVAWGEGGYAEAVENAMTKQDETKVMYDVKADTQFTSILGFIYNRMCTNVTGKVGKVAQR